MKPLAVLTTLLAIFVAVPALALSASQTPSSPINDPQSSALVQRPSIRSLRLDGRRLIVKGDNFDDGAVIVVNDREEKTKRDPDSPADTLVAKKAGKRLVAGSIALVLVVNPNEEESGFEYLYVVDEGVSARYLNPEFLVAPFASSISMSTGDLVLLDFREYRDSVLHGDAHILVDIENGFFTRVMSSPFDSEFFRLYRAEQPGGTSVRLEVRFSEPAPIVRYVSVLVE